MPEPARRPRRRGATAVDVLKRIARQPSGLVGLLLTGSMVLVGVLAPRIAPGDPGRTDSLPLLPPSDAHRFGTDYAGRDLFTAVVHGIRISMTVVLWAGLMSAVIGIAVGAVAGYRGGTLDWLLNRLVEFLQTIPRFFLVALVLTLYGPTERNIILALGLTMWTLLARVVRSEALSVGRREYVEAARSAGSGRLRIIVRHVMPNVLPVALVVVALNASSVVLIEAGLAFLGLGDPNQLSLGQLVNNANNYFLQAWWMSVFPGLALVAVVLGINLLADGLNNALNPRTAGAVALHGRAGSVAGLRRHRKAAVAATSA